MKPQLFALAFLALLACSKPQQQTCPMPQEWGQTQEQCEMNVMSQHGSVGFRGLKCECGEKYPAGYTCEPRPWCIVDGKR
jgi:nitrous oxide reductase accessory protein NosL